MGKYQTMLPLVLVMIWLSTDTQTQTHINADGQRNAKRLACKNWSWLLVKHHENIHHCFQVLRRVQHLVCVLPMNKKKMVNVFVETLLICYSNMGAITTSGAKCETAEANMTFCVVSRIAFTRFPGVCVCFVVFSVYLLCLSNVQMHCKLKGKRRWKGIKQQQDISCRDNNSLVHSYSSFNRANAYIFTSIHYLSIVSALFFVLVFCSVCLLASKHAMVDGDARVFVCILLRPTFLHVRWGCCFAKNEKKTAQTHSHTTTHSTRCPDTNNT